jgi:H+/Cl- antiporter ClcA
MLHNLVPIVLFTGIFATIFGLAYMRSKENMAMLERGLNPRDGQTRLQPFISLKFGLLLTGAGLGLFTAYLLDTGVFAHGENSIDTSPLYPALIGIGGGLGLIICYFIERKHWEKQRSA